MGEYINREEAINAIKSLESSMPAKDNYAKGYDAALGRVQIAVREVPTAADVQPVDTWTSIEESKPKDMQQVLAVVDGEVREAFYNAGCFIGSNFYRSINEVKWWQPLPEPPKDGEQNDT